MFNCQVVFSYYPKGAKRCRCTVPASLRPVLLNSLHHSVLSGHLGAVKAFEKIIISTSWPRMWVELLHYDHRCDIC
jgi:hypothetical protein